MSFSVVYCTLQRSSSLKEDFSMSVSSAGIFSSSLHCDPHPSTRARSLPVPSGTTPTMHCTGEEGGKGEERERKVGENKKREEEGGKEE